ncbi:adhesion G protein-coupled receptor E3-like isoform X1 [Tachysurus ichikawai]
MLANHNIPLPVTAKQAGFSFAEVADFDIEDIVVDVGFWFKGSTNRKGFLAGNKLSVGFTTRARLNHLLDAGDITAHQVDKFQTAALKFLMKAVEYALQKLPLKEPLLNHARFVDVRQRAECGVEDALYFVERYAHLLPYPSPQEHDALGEEFLEYQTMPLPRLEADPDIEGFWANMNATCADTILDNLDKVLNNTIGPLEQKTVELYLNAVMNVSSITENSTEKQLISLGNKVLAVSEKLLVSLVIPTETQKSTNINLTNLEGQIYTVGSMTSLSKIPLLITRNSSLDIDLIGISKKNNGSAAVIFVSYSNMVNILKPSLFKPNSSTNKIMMSSVVSATLPNINSMSFTQPINFTFNHIEDLVPAANLSCVYWKESVWVEDGCSITENENNSVCTCTHLSTFALIMQVNLNQIPSDGYDEVIEIINKVGVSVGMLFLFMTVLTLAVCQRGQKVTNVALLNLSISLFSAHLVFLLKEQFLDNIKLTLLCEVLAGVIHFFFLSAFVWMFIEAVLLYFFVKNLSQMGSKQTELLNWKCMIVIGYVIPLVCVGLFSGLITNAYGGDHCWINTDFVWGFLGPVIAIIAVSLK